ncbi:MULTISPECIES: HNH endonuclease [Mumia]|uniref:HNH endonuclease n=1 Tax=Mumia TaxID=1546255 RepID=UPI0014213C58|nr:HNH endonuclease [Mumia sp. ZJ1417]QMW66404.1 HNH endonuclease [Mumia sp. ZJ1417]
MTAVAEPVVVDHHVTVTRHRRTVLVLNASYEPLQRVSLRHAIRMLVREVAVVEEAHPEDRFGPFPVPKVLRLVRYVVMRWLHGRDPLCTKTAVKARDERCGYCGGPAETVDHILPRSRGGLLTWENSVAACLRCNHRKGDRTPAEAGMTLLVTPAVPHRSPLTVR